MKNILGFCLVVLSIITFFGVVGGLDTLGPTLTWKEWALLTWAMLFGIASGLLGISLIDYDDSVL